MPFEDVEDLGQMVHRMRLMHDTEKVRLDRIYGYAQGDLGSPEVPVGTLSEVKQLARLAKKNVLSLVVGSFAQNLSVTGYRRATASENESAWRLWQRQQMDARQAEVHRPALTYGASYVVVAPTSEGPVFRPRSPRQLLAVYRDPQIDAWPQFALETWVDNTDAKPHLRGALMDDELIYPIDFGELNHLNDGNTALQISRITVVEDPVPHNARLDGKPVCPVVRFINDRDAEDLIVGEVEPLITQQQAINNVNFDRLIVSRFGAFPQKVISGWNGTESEVLKASASRVWTFADPDTKATTLQAASLEQYNMLLTEMLEHVAMVAQISPAQVTGKMVNLSADALAAGEANQQRKLKAKRDSFGESWEQVLRLGAEMDGDPNTAADIEAEVVWRDTEARSFGAVVDGVTKLASVGVPIDMLLTLVPGLSQPQIRAIRDRLSSSNDIIAAIQNLTAQAPAQALNDGDLERR